MSIWITITPSDALRPGIRIVFRFVLSAPGDVSDKSTQLRRLQLFE